MSKGNELINKMKQNPHFKPQSDLLETSGVERKNVQVPQPVHKRLRDLSHKHDRPIYQIITEALDQSDL